MQLLKLIAVSLSLGTLSMAVAAEVSQSDYYEIETLPTEELRMEVGAMMLREDGRMMVGTRTGEIYLLENAYGPPEEVEFKLWARGIAQPLGFVEHGGWIYTAQRGELTRMKDSDGDDVGDVFETVSDDWEISGNYHEYNFGPRLGPDGSLWVTTNKPFGGEPYGRAHWRGWAVKIDPETGKMLPVSAGLRSPAGIENSPWGDMFYTDNQGEWCNASKLSHLEFGDYHGHPHGLITKSLAGEPFSNFPNPVSGTYMKDMHLQNPYFKMPAVWFPYDKMGKSPSGMKWDLTEGGFGPFAGQLFVADQHHANVMRVMLEKIDGHWQGACVRFRDGFQCGIIRICFGQDDSLFVGQSNAGWGGRGNRPWGIQRLRWKKQVPFEIHNVQALPKGFKLTFTQPVAPQAASDPDNYSGESYTYRLESRYGGPESDKQPLRVSSAVVAADRRSVVLQVEPFRAGYVHELKIDGLTNQDGVALLHDTFYYTLVKIPRQIAL